MYVAEDLFILSLLRLGSPRRCCSHTNVNCVSDRERPCVLYNSIHNMRSSCLSCLSAKRNMERLMYKVLQNLCLWNPGVHIHMCNVSDEKLKPFRKGLKIRKDHVYSPFGSGLFADKTEQLSKHSNLNRSHASVICCHDTLLPGTISGWHAAVTTYQKMI